jgi:hypothetical protein
MHFSFSGYLDDGQAYDLPFNDAGTHLACHEHGRQRCVALFPPFFFLSSSARFELSPNCRVEKQVPSRLQRKTRLARSGGAALLAWHVRVSQLSRPAYKNCYRTF